MRQRIPAVFAGSCIAIYFFYLAAGGLRADFTYDDLMNLYFAWIRSIPELLKANLVFFLPPTRSFGNLFYALGFHFAGLEAAPYRVVCFAFLSANVVLTYSFARRMTGSREIAALACLLHAYHGSAAALYYNSGTCYDVFCFFFYFSAFTCYLRIREAGRNPRPWQIAGLACLYIAALNSKEMAVTLPVMMAAYELLYHGRESWSPRIRTAAVLGVITALYIAGTTQAAGSLLKVPGYQPDLSAASYLRQTGSYLNDLIYSTDWFDNARSVSLLLVLALIAWMSRDARLKFCWLFLTLGVLPIAFIAPRGLYAVYIPVVGLAIFLAIVVARISGRVDHTLARTGLFLAATLLLAAVHVKHGAATVSWITTEERHIRDVILQLRRLQPETPKGSRILLLKDPFEGREWDSIFLLRLLYRDNTLVVDRGPETHDGIKYAYIWTVEEGKSLGVTGGMGK